MKGFLAVMCLLAQSGSGADASEDSVAPGAELHGGAFLEVSALALLPGSAAQGFLRLAPSLILDGGDSFGLHVGAPVLLRVGAGSPSERIGAVRAEDWDSLSDFGQLLHALTLGSEASPVMLRAGALEDYSLLSGHLVRRYSNRRNPDYHPAGAFLTAAAGPFQTELFTSDVLAPRLVGGEVAVAALSNRTALSLSVAHDFGGVQERSPPVTLAHADVSAALLMREGLEVHALGGGGARLGMPGLPWGALVGLAFESRSDTLELGVRLEARRQRGGFRQGFFGPDYELSRLRASGVSARPVAEVFFPDGDSVFGELMVGWDWLHLDHAQRQLQLSIAGEVFSSGRMEADARVTGWFARRRVGVTLEALTTGAGQAGTRQALSGEVRGYLARRWYALVEGGTRVFPRRDAPPRSGAFVSLGLGAEYAR